MYFGFPPHIEKGIAEGIYKVMEGKDGISRSIAVLADGSNKIVGHAVALLDGSGKPFNPVVAHAQVIAGFSQIQVGIKSIEASLGVLQTMTALTGIGVAANLAISAVSLWHILKLRDDIKAQRIELREGFLDLKQVIQNQGSEVLQAIEKAVDEVEFRQHRQVLAQAYGRFLEATNLIKLAMACSDISIRNQDLANARQILKEALSDYKNRHLLPKADAITNLRRWECTWVIEQTIAITYQLQHQTEALSQCLGQLQTQIVQNILEVVELCQFENELDIIFPEITRICQQDLVVFKLWQERVNWMRSLSPDEQRLLQNTVSESPALSNASAPSEDLAVCPEQLFYETVKSQSHTAALCDVLKFMAKPETRQQYEEYVEVQAKKANHKALTSTNLEQMSDTAIANLYWYFQVRDESDSDLISA
jgi:hypothetical protein